MTRYETWLIVYSNRSNHKPVIMVIWFRASHGGIVWEMNFPSLLFHHYKPVLVIKRLIRKHPFYTFKVLRSKRSQYRVFAFRRTDDICEAKGHKLRILNGRFCWPTGFDEPDKCFQASIGKRAFGGAVFFPTNTTQNRLDNVRDSVVGWLCCHDTLLSWWAELL